MGLPELNYVDVTVNTQPGHYGLKFPSGVCVCVFVLLRARIAQPLM